ncbi:antibiotic biosynthesis monooxygenase family protein [Nocardia jiangxiensis]|uniref:Antibiotic biosynthesis monooxygenase family protein n=1 Tax=Nocardia jiangxiensis TaxID=282685 RepID=A0ABW6RZ31_9NOCA|nr:antibiotic biosynthesis monooxygenase [Nocardia jiangxiensis]
MTVLEIAVIPVSTDAGVQAAHAIVTGAELVNSDHRCRGVTVVQGVEEPDKIILLIEWASIEAHHAFRDGNTYRQYRATIQDHLSGTPAFSHFETLAQLT